MEQSKKIKLVNVIRFLFLITFIFLLLLSSLFQVQFRLNEFNEHAEKMRVEYYKQQKNQVQREVDNFIHQVNFNSLKTKSLSKETVKNHIYKIHHIASRMHSLTSGKLSLKQQQKLIVETIRHIKTKPAGSNFIIDMKGNLILFSDKPKMEGKNLINIQDAKGNYINSAMITLAQKNAEGFYKYQWSKPQGIENHDEKISFVKHFQPFNWLIGSGVYAEDILVQVQSDLLKQAQSIKFGKNGYIFIMNQKGKILAHGENQGLVGKTLWDLKDTNGVLFVQDLIKSSKKPDGGFVKYLWEKPDTKTINPKISYSKSISEWNWVVGSGLFIDDIEDDINKLRSDLKVELIADLKYISIMTLVGLLFFILLINLLKKKLYEDIELFVTFFKEAANNNKRIKHEHIRFDEFVTLAKSTNQLLEDKLKVKEELKQEKELLETLFNSIHDAVFIHNFKGEIIDVNDTMLDMYGAKKEDVLGPDSLLKLLSAPQTSKELVEELFKKASMGEEQNFSWIARRKDTGELFPISVNLKQIQTGSDSLFLATVRNITEEKRFEKSLQESIERSRKLASDQKLLLENMKDLVYKQDTEGNFTYLSPSIKAITGFDPAEFGKSFADILIDNELKQQAQKISNSALLTGQAQPAHIVEMLNTSGEKIILELNESPYMEEGNVAGIIGVARDITIQKKMEHQIIAEKQFAEEIINGLPGIFFQLDSDFRFAKWNKKSELISGYDQSEILGSRFIKYFDLTYQPIIHSALIAVLEEGEGEIELPLKLKNGQQIPYYWNTRSRVIEGKQLIFGFGIDISSRIDAEKRVFNIKNYLDSIIDSMPSILIGIDRDENIIHWNKTAEKETRVSKEEALDKKLRIVLPKINNVIEQVEKSLNNGDIFENIRFSDTSDGGTIYQNVTIYPLGKNAKNGVVIRIDDTTTQVKLEELMIQSEKILSLGGLAAGMAHEINNPLAAMMTNTTVVLKRLSDSSLPANIKAAEAANTTMENISQFLEERNILNQLNMINESGKRAAEIVRNMLSFARQTDSSAGYITPETLVEDTIVLAEKDYALEKEYDFKKINIVKSFEKDLPKIPCEITKLQQVFLNLFKNGAEAMIESRQATGIPETPQFILRINRHNSFIRFEVEDNGPGIPEGVKKRIFEPFFTTKAVGSGTGLGLSVSYFIISSHHKGEMRVESKPGKGAKFIIDLPLQRSFASPSS